eukprot:SAG31_NODE_10979_length_1076_cov_1.215967_2_plen_294_part_01
MTTLHAELEALQATLAATQQKDMDQDTQVICELRAELEFAKAQAKNRQAEKRELQKECDACQEELQRLRVGPWTDSPAIADDSASLEAPKSAQPLSRTLPGQFAELAESQAAELAEARAQFQCAMEAGASARKELEEKLAEEQGRTDGLQAELREAAAARGVAEGKLAVAHETLSKLRKKESKEREERVARQEAEAEALQPAAAAAQRIRELQDEVENQAEKLRQMSRLLAEQRVAHAAQAKQLKDMQTQAAVSATAADSSGSPSQNRSAPPHPDQLKRNNAGSGQLAAAARKR